jgi:hypothetical protein
MHGAAQFFEALYYGYSLQALYLRLDLCPAFLQEHDEFEVRVNVSGEIPARLHATITQGKLGQVQFWKGDALAEAHPAAGDGLQVGFSKILEIKLSYQLLGLKVQDKTQIQVALWVDDLPVQIIPLEGWLNVELSNDFGGWIKKG